jgi:hypothetical protein
MIFRLKSKMKRTLSLSWGQRDAQIEDSQQIVEMEVSIITFLETAPRQMLESFWTQAKPSLLHP